MNADILQIAVLIKSSFVDPHAAKFLVESSQKYLFVELYYPENHLPLHLEVSRVFSGCCQNADSCPR